MPTLHPPRGLIEMLLAPLLRLTLQLALKPVFSPRRSIAFQRRWLRGLSHIAIVPRAVQVEAVTLGGVPGEWLRGRGRAQVKPGVVLYLHGGAYCVGGPGTHRALAARLTLSSGLPVFVADYRLAPEHPCPAALEDALAVLQALRAQGLGPVVLAGDSAGGGLALATALALRDGGQELPAALVLLSPWVDMADGALPAQAPAGEAMLSQAWADACGAHYRGPGVAADDPRVSPLRADLSGLPPVLIQAGTDELLHGQALALEQALQAAGVAVQCQITPGRWHVFQLHANVLPSANAAIARIARFLQALLAAASPPVTLSCEVAILGAGMSGLCMAYQLRRAGEHDFVMLERQPGLGGTWWDNTYPGAHVDVPAPLYSLSFAPNPDWSRRFAAAPEIQRYMQAVAERHDLLAHLRLDTQVCSADFDAERGRWTLRTTRGDLIDARFFVCSTGPLNQPRWPDIPGLQDFQGQRMHSARWDHGHALAGQRVAVIGTGSTASQLVAPLAQQVGPQGRLQVFQRTANWVLPRLDRRYGALDHWLAQLPPYARLVRWLWMWVLEWGRRGFDEGTLARRRMLALAAWHRQRQVSDPGLRERLTPTYPLGCKRIIYSNDFYPSFSLPQVELVTAGIQRITATGLLTTDGREHALDCIVCATGFETVQLLSSVTVRGLGGRTLREAWAQGPEAYHGISVAGFPNLFLMLGPNTATGHTSTLLYIEPEVRHAIAAMHAVRRGGHRWAEVRAEVFEAHNRALQQRLDGSVWSQCRSWYRTEAGRITALFPGYTRDYVRAVRWNPADYRFG